MPNLDQLPQRNVMQVTANTHERADDSTLGDSVNRGKASLYGFAPQFGPLQYTAPSRVGAGPVASPTRLDPGNAPQG